MYAIYNTTYIHQVLSYFAYFSTSHSTHLSGKFNEYILKALLRTEHIEKRKILLPSSEPQKTPVAYHTSLCVRKKMVQNVIVLVYVY